MSRKLSGREELLAAADLIERFASGRVDNWEWDDFTSLSGRRPDVEALRRDAVSVRDDFPPDHRGGWTSGAGIRRLLEIAERARKEADE